LLERVDPLAPVMGMNAAKVASRCTTPGYDSGQSDSGKIGLVLRSCELRALTELIKLKQASLDDIVTIGVDCLGTYDVPVYVALQAGEGIDRAAMLASAVDGSLAPQHGAAFRDACEMCERPHVEKADITMELFGADLSAGIPVSVPEDIAEQMGAPAGWVADSESGRRDTVVESVVAARTLVRDQRMDQIRARLDEETIEGVLAACVRCHNCMTICPVCYCKTCLFKSATFDHEPSKYLGWSKRKGAFRLPADTMLFHLTRLNHMVLSCVGCGMCTSGCMADLPVGLVFRTIGQEVQAEFNYVPGADVEEPLPMITFREEEWTHVGEQ
jgi:formate dehydrogenase subunit beta